MTTPAMRMRGAGWLFAGQTAYLAAQWTMLVVCVREGGLAMAGQYALGLAVTGPIFLFCNLRLRSALATDARDEFTFDTYWLVRVATTVVAIGVVVVIGAAGPYSSHILTVLVLTALAKAVESLSDLTYGLLQRDPDQLRRVGVSHLLRGVAGAIAFTVGASASGLPAALLGLVGAWAAVYVAFDLPGASALLRGRGWSGSFLPTLPRPLERAAATRLLWLTVPLGTTAALASLSTIIPRYVIERSGGEAALGVFASVASVALAGTVLMNIFGESTLAQLAAHAGAGDRRRFMGILTRLLWLGTAAGLAGVLGAQWFGGAVLDVLYGSGHARHVDLLVILMVAAAILYVASFLGYAIMALRAFRAVLGVLLISTAGSAAACLWLIPRDGLSGAAWAMVWAALIQVAASVYALFVLSARIKGPTHA